MASVLENVTNAAVWGSLAGSVLLGSFLAVQAATDAFRRGRFALLSLVCFVIVATDFWHGWFSSFEYEGLRVVIWSLHAAALLHLFGHRPRAVLSTAIVLPVIGALVWRFIGPELATTAVLPIGFGIAALAHLNQYRKSRGFASLVLGGCNCALALMCAGYYRVITTANPEIIYLGYIHYAVVQTMAILLGWVNLPRELRGLTQVQVSKAHGRLFVGAFFAAELGVQSALLFPRGSSLPVYLTFGMLQLVATLILFFYHRHQLVIYTDNVTQLLDQRTASLRAAQEELSRQNEIQKQLLREQELELNTKAQVIERQRRLELAAQTAGQTAHDIQNLLSPMYAHLSRLENEDAKTDPREIASALRRQADELLDLNAQLLALARRGRFERSPVDLREVADEVSARFPQLKIEVEGGADCWTTGAWSQIGRAVSNLIANAADAIEDSKAVSRSIRISCGCREVQETQRCHLGFLAPGRYSFIAVRDFAGGIPSAEVERIFEPFYSSKSGRERSGSGLGLTIVAAVMDDHNGVIDLRTGSDGTAFTLFFPYAERPALSSSIERGAGTILLVDDDETVLVQYEKFLSTNGYDVISSLSGEEAIRVLQEEPVDLMVLDLSMPRRNGYETFFAALHIRPNTRALVHSSYVTEEERVKLFELGVHSILQKPAGRREILMAVRDALASRTAAIDSGGFSSI